MGHRTDRPILEEIFRQGRAVPVSRRHRQPGEAQGARARARRRGSRAERLKEFTCPDRLAAGKQPAGRDRRERRGSAHRSSRRMAPLLATATPAASAAATPTAAATPAAAAEGAAAGDAAAPAAEGPTPAIAKGSTPAASTPGVEGVTAAPAAAAEVAAAKAGAASAPSAARGRCRRRRLHRRRWIERSRRLRRCRRSSTRRLGSSRRRSTPLRRRWLRLCRCRRSCRHPGAESCRRLADLRRRWAVRRRRGMCDRSVRFARTSRRVRRRSRRTIELSAPARNPRTAAPRGRVRAAGAGVVAAAAAGESPVIHSGLASRATAARCEPSGAPPPD